MPNSFEAYAHLASKTARTGWYAAVARIMGRRVAELSSGAPRFQPTRPTPGEGALFRAALALQRRDAENVRRGLYPAMEDEESLSGHIEALRRMFADLPASNERRLAGRAEEAAALPEAEGLPDYYARNFHYQTDGYLSEESARIYDIQVDTLFIGTSGTMRRQALPPIAAYVHGKDQRNLAMLDVACGTGRFLGQAAQAFPAMPMTGIDLSAAYIDAAREHLADRRTITLQQGNGEALPLPDASQDIVTSIYLYHELPGEVRRKVTTEILRVLKPGGIYVLVDSLQWGDEPRYDGLLEAFPERFHEPYYEHFLGDDLAALFEACGFERVETSLAFLSKVVVGRKPISPTA
ncbi:MULTISPECIES: class I SAM-dependent methyltransferase [Rhodomicrobium]|uniref:class I SAM-dependent methyltransferase n=1 Tax=Rhodomicrobium TaxID=1068 RepID=UPI000B4B45A8|nr:MULTISPECIES: class I SAM-dependent methyltransferase [Rhodomicrobium]